MTTFVDEDTARIIGTLPSVFEQFPRPTTQARHGVRWRKLALLGSLLAAPAAVGILCARGSTRGRGALAGGIAAVALGALRVELARWFTPEPDYEADGKLADLQFRRYPARIEASTEIDDANLEEALDHGYGRLACYVCGSNQAGELLPRTTPILTSMRDGRYSVSFVMPPGRRLGELPRPDHPGVVLREVPARMVAALRFHGRFTRDNIAKHERRLLQQLVDNGLSARGSVTFAAYDSPLTLPLLRRNELWIEIV
jgi:SOUL heme-binding protein